MFSNDLFRVAALSLAWNPTSCLGFLSVSQKSPAPSTTAVGSAEPPRNNGMMEPGVQRDTLVQDLQSEIAALYATIAEQKYSYQSTMEKLQSDANVRVEEATEQVNSVKDEYESYKVEIALKLKNAATPEEMARLKGEVRDLDERAATLKEKLDDALAKLRQNREDRENLQAEMVVLRQGYIERLNEMEDQLEFVQDERVRDQQEGARLMTEIQEENKKKLKEAIDDGRKQVEELTVVYTQRLAQKDNELENTKSALGKAHETVREKEETIEKLESEAQSIRKLLGKSLSVLKGRVSKRLAALVPGKRKRQDR